MDNLPSGEKQLQGPGLSSDAKHPSHEKHTAHSLRSNWLKNSATSKSMPHNIKPSFTAEDDKISSMRTYRYLKLEPTCSSDLPPPRKFANFTKPNVSNGRLTRSKSTLDFGAQADSPIRPAYLRGAQSQASDASISARLRDCLFMDEFQLLRPSSPVAMCDLPMCNTPEEEAGDEIVYAHMHFADLVSPVD
jgi:hypothetical protein